MLDALRRVLKERELSMEKTKVIVFNKHGKERKEKWIWEGREIEEVKYFKYLGYIFNRKGDTRNI